ncbi:ribonuclease domain-containing protein [Streptomyces canus]|uniref:ribonuclease domain-containing protein n=1 Tax=Streptomyces canus TaxID=58343 RepID=UPI0036C37A08
MLLRFVSRMLLCVLFLTGCSATDHDPSRGGGPATDHDPSRGGGPATDHDPSRGGGPATVQESKLPAEARQTLELIDRGGPFPYAKDGSVFGNFERLLPAHQRGYYHEYTVPTPGSRDRGARRIVTGQGGEIYYTDDHYDSFRAVLR